jgi:hypothetical protein
MKNLFSNKNGWTVEAPKKDGLYACRYLGGNNDKVMIIIIRNGYIYPLNESAIVSFRTVSVENIMAYTCNYKTSEWFKIEESKTVNFKLTWWDFWFGLFVFGYFLIAVYGSLNTCF